MTLIHSLRKLMYNGTGSGFNLKLELELLERTRMADLMNSFSLSYMELLKLVSTPIPFALVQMGRTFLFLYVFSVPFVLLGVIEEMLSGLLFVFFLTYGFMGLEFVSMELYDPFGDLRNGLNIAGMRKATVDGIERDCKTDSDEHDPSNMRSLDSTKIYTSSKRLLKGLSSDDSEMSYVLRTGD
eukprot:CAMPEP_0194388840 /NCGR_PEP_ID=MMETSP0174-20130528/100610_1 /TAXON_ID=216777 /ORGANISM="Proboscia alata, Strain PI-D3" /LENGTH=183 /DNA_ID=CAMNT_0039180491 /DNA_START=732 /DNA_END=1283 /DNA_ORIENTATION=-